MNTFYLWTIGCQMNTADSDRLAAALEQMGMAPVEKAAEADVIVLNSCVVRQGAEDKVVGNLGWMAPLKKEQPDRILALMGCMVGPKSDDLARRFPYVDVFMRPQEFEPLLEKVGERMGVDWEGCVGPLTPVRPDVTCHVPIIHGCDLMCTFCIIPYRRGRQVSRPVAEVAQEVEILASRGVKEVTLLGQTVDAYGHDLPDTPSLADLFTRLNDIDGIERIRFLTSHPKFMTQEIVQAVADLPKVCEHINLPVQAGDDGILDEMRRQYSRRDYIELVGRIRETMPEVAINTDIIVGFPGETEEQFQQTLDLLAELRLDKVHCAAYSTRPGTIASRTMEDAVPDSEKTSRRQRVDKLQEQIQTEMNAELVGSYEEILVEGRQRGKWQGRTRSNKLVFFEDEAYHLGNLVTVKIERSSPWSLQGTLAVEAKFSAS
ncbi:MAG: tRNA (N6-isopentenyl adenosine(37)-C2)-methylthiotransferase MiaB [SAR202 cluster bacterium]|nr:tRNA (N6-isopentenyl adenosine(37)-C2)-methylthiotransferase MiaB [Chloroflexota bacterium]MQG33103.1 tRNA (N6-isopentenyl adenosine(37)-C2)-methylthiotransferase MiaB [SAR202 cluster bacterium]HAA95145.1 tRNA (N6-isopentenyl adenosine(37)-C2)-methylthiotransferase MiaB [Dehalococcoidia bacterium]HCL25922.1 tRNA (N6-isopentenyl adenosine(37)-C2)-methylthiotransferase MiaB [Dehalococcoidia bacterium]HCP24295.1 tRNA (N6-isopentenyl adenosine(37)-C2)-methylthiotransferase MiaB [Dehalococcoidia |tara:strand:- start:1843 stop:3141 length:1299 start_codon:yes stop_codon:yes gene_type:complete